MSGRRAKRRQMAEHERQRVGGQMSQLSKGDNTYVWLRVSGDDNRNEKAAPIALVLSKRPRPSRLNATISVAYLFGSSSAASSSSSCFFTATPAAIYCTTSTTTTAQHSFFGGPFLRLLPALFLSPNNFFRFACVSLALFLSMLVRII